MPGRRRGSYCGAGTGHGSGIRTTSWHSELFSCCLQVTVGHVKTSATTSTCPPARRRNGTECM